MTCIDPAGVLGAKRATWRSVNPRELLQRIIAENPGDSEEQWRRQFWASVETNEEYLQAICSYWLITTFAACWCTSRRGVPLTRNGLRRSDNRAMSKAQPTGRLPVNRGLKLALDKAGGLRPLARCLGLSHASVIQWRNVPIDRVFAIEKKLGIPREELRPDIFNHPRPM